MEILSARRGSIFVEHTRAPRTLTVAGSATSLFDGILIIATGFRLGRQESFQQIRTFANKFFTYSFGEKPGLITISGIFFYSNGCTESSSDPAAQLSSSDLVARINSTYESMRAWSSSGYQSVAVGGAAFRALLVGLEVSADAEDMGIGRMQLTFSTIPNEAK